MIGIPQRGHFSADPDEGVMGEILGYISVTCERVSESYDRRRMQPIEISESFAFRRHPFLSGSLNGAG